MMMLVMAPNQMMGMIVTLVMITMIVMKKMTREEDGRMAVDAQFDNNDVFDNYCDDHENSDDSTKAMLMMILQEAARMEVARRGTGSQNSTINRVRTCCTTGQMM